VWRKLPKIRSTVKWLLIGWLSIASMFASEQSGQVLFAGLPVPGASIIATQGEKKVVTTTDQQGSYTFADLPDGT
jgi:hypothetical protein